IVVTASVPGFGDIGGSMVRLVRVPGWFPGDYFGFIGRIRGDWLLVVRFFRFFLIGTIEGQRRFGMVGVAIAGRFVMRRLEVQVFLLLVVIRLVVSLGLIVIGFLGIAGRFIVAIRFVVLGFPGI